MQPGVIEGKGLCISESRFQDPNWQGPSFRRKDSRCGKLRNRSKTHRGSEVLEETQSPGVLLLSPPTAWQEGKGPASQVTQEGG